MSCMHQIVRIKRLREDAEIPKYATDGSACFDLHACIDDDLAVSRPSIWRPATAVIPTGLAVEIPKGFVLLIFSRSGQGFKDNIRLANCVGVIDSDYRGEIKVKLTRDDPEGFVVRRGDRVAQAMLFPAIPTTFLEVDELSETARGAGGFGSTGK